MLSSDSHFILVDMKTKKEVLWFGLTEDDSIETAIVLAGIYKTDGQVRINAVGLACRKGLQAILNSYQN